MKQRLFIGIDPSEALRQEIVKLQTSLQALKLPLVLELPEKLHLTLNFIGAVDKEKTADIQQLIKHAVFGIPPFTLTPAFLETLYQKHGSSIIYLGLTGEIQMLKNLQGLLADGLTESGISQPGRYLPHLTVAKFKKADPVLIKSFIDKVDEFAYTPLSEFTVSQIVLFESLLSKDGSHYRRIGHFALHS